MKRAAGVLILLALLLLPVAVAEAKPIVVSSSTFASSSVSSTVSGIGDWLKETLGLDLYETLTKIIAFVIFGVKIAVNLLLEILPKIRDILSNY